MPVLRPVRLPVAILAALSALFAAGCGSSGVDERKLIAQSRAAAMVQSLERAERELADGRCNRATDAVGRLRAQVSDLPQSYDGRLVANLTEWVDYLEQRVPADCEAAKEPEEEEETPTPTPTKTPEEEEKEKETPTPTATPVPTQTPVPTVTPVPTAPPTGGGQGEGGEGGGGDEGGGGGGGSEQPSTGGVPPEDG